MCERRRAVNSQKCGLTLENKTATKLIGCTLNLTKHLTVTGLDVLRPLRIILRLSVFKDFKKKVKIFLDIHQSVF